MLAVRERKGHKENFQLLIDIQNLHFAQMNTIFGSLLRFNTRVNQCGANISNTTVALIGFALFATAMLLIADFVCFPQIVRQYGSQHYSKTTGKILYYEIQNFRRSSGHGYSSASYESVKTRYSYQVNGQSFESQKYRYFLSYSGNKFIAPDYSAGSTVPVFYNPQNPKDAVLNQGLNNNDVTFLLAAAFFNLFALIFWWVVGAKIRFHFSDRAR
jgi:Protein of unknown function (DUF3592)